METNLTPGLAELLGNAEKATSKAADLTRQLLTFAKGGVPVLKTVSLEGIVRDTTEFALRGSNVKPVISFADDLRAVSADEGQISQVINNLVINANQAMPDGGTLRIHCRNYTIETRCALPLSAGDYVTITVADQGGGITPEHLSKIFDPFFTTKKTGNGLGLASSYSIIRKHHGHIEVESELGIGTTFTVYLPATLKETEQSEEVDSTIPRGSGRILVLDDEGTIRIITEKTLSKLGYEVVTSEDGWAAIELYRDAQQAGNPFAAVILDLTIPGGMGGRDVIGFLRKMNPEVKAIVASGYSNDPVLAEYREYGFSGMIVKPYTARTLGETLHNVLVRTKVSV